MNITEALDGFRNKRNVLGIYREQYPNFIVFVSGNKLLDFYSNEIFNIKVTDIRAEDWKFFFSHRE